MMSPRASCMTRSVCQPPARARSGATSSGLTSSMPCSAKIAAMPVSRLSSPLRISCRMRGMNWTAPRSGTTEARSGPPVDRADEDRLAGSPPSSSSFRRRPSWPQRMTWSGPSPNDASSASPAMAKTTGLRPCRPTAAAMSAGRSPPPARMATGPLDGSSVMDRSGVGGPRPRACRSPDRRLPG